MSEQSSEIDHDGGPSIGDSSTSLFSENSGTTTITRPSTPSLKDHRWSEVVPPDGGLTFAAVFDPEEGLMTFSGAALHPPTPRRPLSRSVPSDAPDDRSLVSSTIDSGTAEVALVRERFDIKTPIYERYMHVVARASSTCQGIDRYSGGRRGESPHHAERVSCSFKPSRHWSVFNQLDVAPAFDPQTAFGGITLERRGPRAVRPSGGGDARNRPSSDITDDGAVLVELNLRSAFSVSTSSISAFVEVDLNAIDDDTLRAPDANCAPNGRRRLRKRPPPQRPAPPVQVLAPADYNHGSSSLDSSPPTSDSTASKGSLQKIAGRLGLGRAPDERWVLVDVMHTVTVKQRLV